MFYALCNWIVKNWGGIKNIKEQNIKKGVDAFYEHDTIKFQNISSISKIAAFIDPNENVIYDSRALSSLDWILLATGSRTKFFPIPKGRDNSMIAFDIGVLIRLKNISKYQQSPNFTNVDSNIFIDQDCAYAEFNKTLKKINCELWKDDKRRKSNPFYTEMLLFSIAKGRVMEELISQSRIIIKKKLYPYKDK